MKLSAVKLIKDPKTNSFYLLGPGFLKEKVEHSIEQAWDNLNQKFEENRAFLTEAGLEDEIEQFNISKIFNKGLILKYMMQGAAITVPIFIGFFIFSYAITGQFTKLAGKIHEITKPYSEKSAREEMGFKQTLERYRPYVYETIKLVKEESAKAELKMMKHE